MASWGVPQQLHQPHRTGRNKNTSSPCLYTFISLPKNLL
jgi:hypothetical protein